MSAPTTVRPDGPAQEPRVWQDATRSPDERVEHLVEQMTLEEKVAQLVGCGSARTRRGAASPRTRPT